MKYLSYAFLALLTAFPFVSRASIASKLNDLEDCRVAITNAIVAKGGTASGALTNAAAEIAELPSGGGGWDRKPWKNDGKSHIWLRIEDPLMLKVSFTFDVIAPSGIVIEWGDGEVNNIASSASLTARTFSYSYLSVGDYEIVMSGITNFRLGDYNFGRIYRAETTPFVVRQIEMFGDATLRTGVWMSFGNLMNLEYVFFNGNIENVPNQMFIGCLNIKSIEFNSLGGVIGNFSSTSCSLKKFTSQSSSVTSLSSSFSGDLLLNESIDLSSCTSLGGSSFAGCVNITSISSMPLVETIKDDFSYCKSLSSNINIPSCRTLTSSFQYCAALPSVYAPSCTSIGDNCFRECFVLKNITFGTLTSVGGGSGSTTFSECGRDLSIDSSGFKTIVSVGNTMASLRAIAGFPWRASTFTKWVCSDGYISYENGAWTDHAN